MFQEISPCKLKDDSIILKIKVTTQAKKAKFGKISMDANGNNFLKMYIKSPPENNKANNELIDLLAVNLDIRKNSVNIINGHTDRNKNIEIFGDPSVLQRKIFILCEK